ncbi:MAG: prefoldin subunit alpha [Nanoarchaeota archaeon]|nr:prefoldin subunit alpha [Nanoarchaeota archaeon]MCG2718485.1 prefoldin subunit alpha [Nanoarchaeota archaeon]
MADQKDMTNKYLELQMVEQQLKQVNQQLLTLDMQLAELQQLEENLDDLSKTKRDTEMLVALGGGVFSKAELKENKKVLMNVGADIIIEKDIPSSKKVISDQVNQIKEVVVQMEQEFQILAMNSQMLQQDIQKLSSETTKEQ